VKGALVLLRQAGEVCRVALARTGRRYCSGQAANDETGAAVLAGDMRGQIALALDNLETLLAALFQLDAGGQASAVGQASRDWSHFCYSGCLVL
jgi:hypothetical protein